MPDSVEVQPDNCDACRRSTARRRSRRKGRKRSDSRRHPRLLPRLADFLDLRVGEDRLVPAGVDLGALEPGRRRAVDELGAVCLEPVLDPVVLVAGVDRLGDVPQQDRDVAVRLAAGLLRVRAQGLAAVPRAGPGAGAGRDSWRGAGAGPPGGSHAGCIGGAR